MESGDRPDSAGIGELLRRLDWLICELEVCCVALDDLRVAPKSMAAPKTRASPWAGLLASAERHVLAAEAVELTVRLQSLTDACVQTRAYLISVAVSAVQRGLRHHADEEAQSTVDLAANCDTAATAVWTTARLASCCAFVDAAEQKTGETVRRIASAAPTVLSDARVRRAAGGAARPDELSTALDLEARLLDDRVRCAAEDSAELHRAVALQSIVSELRGIEAEIEFHAALLETEKQMCARTTYTRRNFSYGSTPFSSWLEVTIALPWHPSPPTSQPPSRVLLCAWHAVARGS